MAITRHAVCVSVAIQSTYRMDTRKNRLSPKLAWPLLVKGFNMLVPVLFTTGLCLIVYPRLSIVLWLQGFRNMVQDVKQIQSKTEPWERRKVGLGEEEEWFIARTHSHNQEEQAVHYGEFFDRRFQFEHSVEDCHGNDDGRFEAGHGEPKGCHNAQGAHVSRRGL